MMDLKICQHYYKQSHSHHTSTNIQIATLIYKPKRAFRTIFRPRKAQIDIHTYTVIYL